MSRLTLSRSLGGRWLLLAMLAAGAAGISANLWADDQSQGAAARLSSVDGGVQVVQDRQVLADPAAVNTPLFDGMLVTTSQDGKAEVQFQDGSVVRVAPGSSLSIVTLSGAGGTELALNGGLAYVEIPAGVNGQLRIHFGSSMATLTGAAIVRIRMDTPPGDLAVFSGNVHLEQGSAVSLDLHNGESVTLNGSDPGRYSLAETVQTDSWDAWNTDRDAALNAQEAEQTSVASSYVGSDNANPAWSDLDANGNWYNVPGQGYVWSPYSASSAGWDPYGCGRWAWTPGHGYVWISCENWGFMPYMCGQWSYYDNFGWGWAPGMGMGCGRGWGMGYYGGGGVHIGRRPDGYLPIQRPGPRRPIGRVPAPIIVSRIPAGGGLPVRGRNEPVRIGGQTIQPLPRNVARGPSGGGAGNSFVHRSDPVNVGTRTPGGTAPGSVNRPVQSGNGGSRPGYTPGGNGNTPGQSFVRGSQPVTAPTMNPGVVNQPTHVNQPGNTGTQPVVQQPQNNSNQHTGWGGWMRGNNAPGSGGSPSGGSQSRPTPSPSTNPGNSGGAHPSGGGFSGGGVSRPSGGGFSGGGGSHPSGGGNSGGGGGAHPSGGSSGGGTQHK